VFCLPLRFLWLLVWRPPTEKPHFRLTPSLHVNQRSICYKQLLCGYTCRVFTMTTRSTRDQYGNTSYRELSRSSSLPLPETCRQVGEESHANPKTIRTAVSRLLRPRNNNGTATSSWRNHLARVGTAWAQTQIIHFGSRLYREARYMGLALRCWISLSVLVARSSEPTDIKCLKLKMSDIEQFIEKAGSVLKGDPKLIIIIRCVCFIILCP
jgi:hypothetical protein